MPVATAREVVDRCRILAGFSQEPSRTTRTFLSPPMRDVHAYLGAWMQRAGMSVRVDDAGNLRGVYLASSPGRPRLFIGSHLDTVPNAGAFDGVLGVVLAIALYARYGRLMAGGWRAIYVVTAVAALYLNVFVLIVQLFLKVPALNALAPTQTEPPFAIAQLVVLIAFAGLGTAAVKRFRLPLTRVGSMAAV